MKCERVARSTAQTHNRKGSTPRCRGKSTSACRSADRGHPLRDTGASWVLCLESVARPAGVTLSTSSDQYLQANLRKLFLASPSSALRMQSFKCEMKPAVNQSVILLQMSSRMLQCFKALPCGTPAETACLMTRYSSRRHHD